MGDLCEYVWCRLATVRNADTIVVMSQGRVAEQGSHTQLLARGGIYASLVKRQSSGVDESDRDMAPEHAYVRTTLHICN